MEAKRVVITGMGTVNPLGNDVNSTWENVIKGKSGIGTITAFPVDTYRCQVAGMVKKFDLENYYKESSVSRANKLDKYVHYAVAATKEALENANLNVLDYQDETGIVLGTGIGGMNISQESVRILFDKGHRKVSPFSVPGIIPNTAAGFVSIEFGIKGANFAVSSACASGNHSISVAMMIIQTGQAKVMIAGGSESSINKIVLAGFENMKALATSYNARPTEASRPYDKDREGFVMGEGAGTLILEEYEFAKKKKSKYSVRNCFCRND